MDTYVCLIVNRQRQILTVEALTAENEGQACRLAHEVAAGQPGAVSLELWRNGKKVVCTLEGAASGAAK